MEALLPEEKPARTNGRPVVPFRKILEGIFYVPRTGCQWKALPQDRSCSGSTAHRRFQQWRELGVFQRLFENSVAEYDELRGIAWKFQAVDGAMVKAPWRGKKIGPNPTDRGKSGTKRSLHVDERGAPLAITLEGANRHDMKMIAPTLNGTVVQRSRPTRENRQHMCLDKGYDYPEIRDLIFMLGFMAHIKARGKEEKERKRNKRYKARRWVVERIHSWLNRYRKILVRFENYEALLHVACAAIALRAARILR